MITPAFQIDQDPHYLILDINAPYVKSNDVEIYIEGNEFKFFVKPYFLRLYFPAEIIEDGRETATYDISTGIFHLKLPKKNSGELFHNLDMLTTLLAPKKGTIKPIIEVVSGETTCSNESEDEDEEDYSWELEQQLYNPSENILAYKYGFADQSFMDPERVKEELSEVIDLHDPYNTPPHERHSLRINTENEQLNKAYLPTFL